MWFIIFLSYKIKFINLGNFLFFKLFWFQPEVEMDIEIKKPSLYRLIYRYVNVNNNILRGQVKLKPHNPTDVTQSSEVFFQVTTEPMFVTVGSGRDYEFVLNPGRWTVSISSPDILLLVRNFVNCLEIYTINLFILLYQLFSLFDLNSAINTCIS